MRQADREEGRRGVKEMRRWQGHSMSMKTLFSTASKAPPGQEESDGIAVLSDLDFHILWQRVLLEDIDDKLEATCT